MKCWRNSWGDRTPRYIYMIFQISLNYRERRISMIVFVFYCSTLQVHFMIQSILSPHIQVHLDQQPHRWPKNALMLWPVTRILLGYSIQSGFYREKLHLSEFFDECLIKIFQVSSGPETPQDFLDQLSRSDLDTGDLLQLLQSLRVNLTGRPIR